MSLRVCHATLPLGSLFGIWIRIAVYASVGRGFQASSTNASSVLSWGSDRCPCLSDQILSKDVFYGNPPGYNNLSLARKNAYGVGCAFHNLAVPAMTSACASDPRPDFCDRQWCYVDSASCLLRHGWSNLRVGRAYSYATCGYKDTYQTASLESQLEGKTLTIARMHNSGGWRGSFCKTSQYCSGPAVDISNLILEGAGAYKNVLITFVGGPLSSYPRALPSEVLQQVFIDYPIANSTFTACVYATGMGFVDICVGEFDVTPERMSLSSFVTLWERPVYLFTKFQMASVTFSERCMLAFRPFSVSVWVAILSIVILTPLVLCWMEYVPHQGSVLHQVSVSLYRGILSCEKRGTAFDPQTAGGRIVNLGLGIFLLLAMTLYTASLVKHLVVVSPPVTTINDLVDITRNHGYRVCTFRSAEKLLMGLGLPDSQIIAFLSRSDVLDAVDSGTCIAAALPLEDVQKYQGARKFCNLMRVGEPLFSIRLGLPVSDRVYKTLELLNTQLLVGGHIQTIINRYSPRNMCREKVSTEAEGVELVALLGPLVLAGLSILLGAGVHIIQLQQVRKRSDRPDCRAEAKLGVQCTGSVVGAGTRDENEESEHGKVRHI